TRNDNAIPVPHESPWPAAGVAVPPASSAHQARPPATRAAAPRPRVAGGRAWWAEHAGGTATPAAGHGLSWGTGIALSFLVAVGALLAFLRPLERWLRGRDAPYARAYVSFLAQPRVGALLLLVLSFRTGESFLMKMKWPFFQDVMGVGLDVYGAANGTVGLAASVGATMLGGALIARHGLRRWLWPFILGQNLLNLLYVVLAEGWLGQSTTAVVAVITAERIGEGLGTAVFMVYLMRCCRPEHRAAHMAIVTALMSVGFTVAGIVSGELAATVGFSTYFALSFAATIPMMILLRFAPHLDR
ncbi:MAG: MFS transporter, partial [Myxococcota bacterium]